MGKKSIRDVMTTNPTAIAPSTPIAEAARSMKAEDVGALPVVEGDRLTGMLTDRDIVIRGIAEGKDAQSATAGEVASRDVVSVDPDQSLDEALRLMGEHQIRRLPVTEEDGRLVGIVAQADIAREGQDARTGKVVEKISR